jgi:predicted nucleotidyltransferase
MTNSLATYRTERDDLLDKIARLLQADTRVVAAWLFGSLARGSADELSDIDIWIVVADEHWSAVADQRRAYVAQVGEPFLLVEAPQNAPEGGAYLGAGYEAPLGPHLVDWHWQPQALAFIPPYAKLLFDRVELRRVDRPVKFVGGAPNPHWANQPFNLLSYFWMMLLISARRARRNPHLKEIELFSSILHPLDEINQLLKQPSASPTIPLLPSAASKLRFLRHLAHEMKRSMEQMTAQGMAVPVPAPAAAEKYLTLLIASLPPHY